ncbi:MAG: hypothetical protein GW817_04470, partial [Flavobacteriales bacterium]|nr:hypothetical protein [Flavobacteriales bacterium]
MKDTETDLHELSENNIQDTPISTLTNSIEESIEQENGEILEATENPEKKLKPKKAKKKKLKAKEKAKAKEKEKKAKEKAKAKAK